ncbi:hypothetical protein TBLA_0I03220 [Henningerozyma blattae CBS 6284]|uniref:Carboxypeptidase n=1 Tax=Henningerozyma blattae (strain ATCC 34711 / CBS 6284 / DSM 70876 / NBRC 10599 / NRRL Y-10934 / UCD 77-7) TaxID=1071380 RepID=I2H9C5_HENB6|nr:hypothetical protein TBLA_0I03220 [Tetrapisispora blattae CBS 6284]CCH62977.1 hypothetical protein TBLA_0I03220 [Tetrapisispora blattae CBS 6284]
MLFSYISNVMVVLSALSVFSNPLLADSLPDQNSFKVIPELIPGVSNIDDKSAIPIMHAGLMPLAGDHTDKEEYFFWKFQKSDFDSPSIVIWLNGGPGCSSMDGAVLELGPLRVGADNKVHLNQGSWFTRADLLFVDQPLGTGFSQGNFEDYDTNLDEVASNFLQFLESYFTVFPEDLEKDLLLAGESYAGQYIPYVAKAILDQNKIENSVTYNLEGIFIGNGWIDPDTQSLAYLPFALEKNLVSKDNPGFQDLLKTHENCQKAINSVNSNNFSHPECEIIINKLIEYTKNTSEETPENEVCLNVYDYSLRDSFPACGMSWPSEIVNAVSFFSTEGVMEALNLDSTKLQPWRECNLDVQNTLTNENSKPSIHLFPELIDSDVSVFLFNGDKDLICNDRGVLDSLKGIQWGNSKGFSKETEHYYLVIKDSISGEETPAGYVLYDSGLTFISIANASHMAPYDQPFVTRGILDIFYNDIDLIENPNNDTLIISDAFLLEKLEDDEEDEEHEKNNKNAEKEHDNEEDDRHHSDEEEDEEGEESDDDNDDDDDDENDKHKRTRYAFVSFFSIGLLGVIFWYIIRQARQNTIQSILRNRKTNLDEQNNKTVSWTDSNDATPDVIFEQDFDPKGSSTRTKNGYTGVPSTDLDESFEMRDF